MKRLFAFVLAIASWIVFASAAVAQAATPATPAVPATGKVDYVLGAGDAVRSTVFQSPELSLELRLSETGKVSYPLLGEVQLGGLTVGQAEKRIADGLKAGNFLKQPQVTLVVTQVRGNQASVIGQVNRPGRYALELADMRLTDLVALAGGVAPNGSDIVTVSGLRNGKAFRVQIDLPSVFSSAGRANDMPILNGDVVYVDRAPTVYIYGEVQRPGVIRLERGMTVMQALASGGGLTLRGTEKGLRVHRRGADGQIQVLQPKMDDALTDADVVYVRESLF